MALSNLAARVLFAVIAIPVVIAAVFYGDLVLAVLLALAGGFGAWEFYRLAAAAGYAPFPAVGVPAAALVPLAVHFYHAGRFTPPTLTLIAVVALIIFALAVLQRGPAEHPIGATTTTLFGILYTGGMLSFAYGLRYHNYVVGAAAGTALLGFPVVLTWVCDTAAFFVGHALGRHKLMPSVSPGKTVEGAVGGLVFTMLGAWAYARWVLVPFASLGMTAAVALALGALLAVAVQIGDLAESLIKREAGAKDSSHLIPGHGGVLDRLDSLFFSLPTAYLALTFPHVLLVVAR